MQTWTLEVLDSYFDLRCINDELPKQTSSTPVKNSPRTPAQSRRPLSSTTSSKRPVNVSKLVVPGKSNNKGDISNSRDRKIPRKKKTILTSHDKETKILEQSQTSPREEEDLEKTMLEFMDDSKADDEAEEEDIFEGMMIDEEFEEVNESHNSGTSGSSSDDSHSSSSGSGSDDEEVSESSGSDDTASESEGLEAELNATVERESSPPKIAIPPLRIMSKASNKKGPISLGAWLGDGGDDEEQGEQDDSASSSGED